MVCSYCGCSVAEGDEYCFFCKAEQPLNLQQRKKYRWQILILSLLLVVQLAIVFLLSNDLSMGRFAQRYLEKGNYNGFTRHMIHNSDLQRDPDVNRALEKNLQELNASLANPQLESIDTAASCYNALFPLSIISSKELITQTVRAYTQEFTEIQTAYDNLKKVQTMKASSLCSYRETFSALDAAYHTFNYSDPEYAEMCKAAFSIYIEQALESDKMVSIGELNSLRSTYITNEMLYDAATEATSKLYEMKITAAIEANAFQGSEGAVAQAVEYCNMEGFQTLYETDLIERIHVQLKVYLSELMQQGEYLKIVEILDGISYAAFNGILEGNGDITSYYHELHATAVSLHIAQQMNIHNYISYSGVNTGAIQIAHRYAKHFPEIIDLDSLEQTATVYERECLLERINQTRRENGHNGLKMNQSLNAMAQDFIEHTVEGNRYATDTASFYQLFAAYGFEGEDFGWARAEEIAKNNVICYSNSIGDAWDYIKTKDWLTDVGIGISYHEKEETFYWCIISMRN